MGYSAIADIPVTWDFYHETYGSRDDWYSTPSFIDPGYSSYDYIWEITSTQVQVQGSWWAGPSGFNGSGITGSLPIIDLFVYHIDEPEIEADIFVSVDSAGIGDIYIDNVIFGEAQSNPVTGTKFWGNVTITPEPMTISLLGLGGLALLRKRIA